MLKPFEEFLPKELTEESVLKAFSDWLKQATNQKPLGKLLLIEKIEEDTEHAILLPETFKAKKSFGIVLARGNDVYEEIKVGDKVMWLKEEGEVYRTNGRDYIYMACDRLKAIIE